ncbi:MAG: hypothetical protein QM608_09085 [Caulobacter sp.]
MKLLITALAFTALSAAWAQAAPAPRLVQFPRADDTQVQVDVYDRAEGSADRALLLVQGSTCMTSDAISWRDQVLRETTVRWVAIVRKDGAAADGGCGADYEAHAVEEARWFDNLAAVHRLKTQLNLRARGAFDVLAVSAGGLTACALAGATDDVGALALLSTGGGMTFEAELDLLTKGDKQLVEERRRVRADPRLGKTWMGETNPEIWWWSVLGKRCAPLLDGYAGPTLVIHGVKDESTPIESARTLVEALKAGGRPVDFVEMPTGHALGLKSLPADRSGIGRAMAWFRAQDRAPRP